MITLRTFDELVEVAGAPALDPLCGALVVATTGACEGVPAIDAEVEVC